MTRLDALFVPNNILNSHISSLAFAQRSMYEPWPDDQFLVYVQPFRMSSSIIYRLCEF